MKVPIMISVPPLMAPAAPLIPIPARAVLPRPLHAPLARLRNITGFATVYGAHEDPRLRLFSRLGHVHRVAALAHTLTAVPGGPDPAAVARLAWIHDLNRWPFAHNSERGHFDQVGSVASYLAAFDVTDQDIADVIGIKRKDPHQVTDAGRIVLLADAIVPAVEDPLLALIGLNVHPRIIPGPVSERLGFTLDGGEVGRSCRRLAAEFHGPRPPSMPVFAARFHQLFTVLVETFLALHCAVGLWADFDRILALTRQVGEQLLVRHLLPINNELVCNGAWVRSTVMSWYLARTPDRSVLLELDERDFVAKATGPGSPFTPGQFRPDLDAVRRTRPDLVFVP